MLFCVGVAPTVSKWLGYGKWESLNSLVELELLFRCPKERDLLAQCLSIGPSRYAVLDNKPRPKHNGVSFQRRWG